MPRNGLSSLLRPEDSVLVLIDHQPYQLAKIALAAGSPPDMSEERLGHFLATAAAYGYWNGGPDEQALL
ncbi:hypothetical protein ACMGDM_17035 [Sphingomonas sp. DT-51]|uniref:hypothetical protein n=1 Tax=Sphingomonas sp. DT-51 TaxID=3396165 RepID=UPI003F1D94E9